MKLLYARQEDLGHQYLLLPQAMPRTARPQRRRHLRNNSRALIERMALIEATKLDGATPKARAGKKQEAKRTITQTGEPASQAAICCGRQAGMGKNHRHSVALKQHFTNSDAAAGKRFVHQCPTPRLRHNLNPKLPTQALAARSQRTRLFQPSAQLARRPAAAKI